MTPGKILVFGGGGLIGEGLKSHSWHADVQYLTSKEFNILEDRKNELMSCDTIIDLVPSPFVSTAESNENDYHKIHTIPHIEFISRALSNGVKNYIFVSSGGSVYGPVEKGEVIRESHPANPVSNYGKSKLKIEKALIELSEKFHSRYVILRPGNVFNENPESLIQKGLIGALLNCVRQNKTFNLFGSGEISKDYISNKDVGLAIIKAVNVEKSGVFNLGTGQALSIQEIISMFERSFNKKITVEHKAALQSDVEWNCLNNLSAENVLKFKPQKTLMSWLDSFAKEK